MKFIYDKELKNLKLILKENNDDRTIYFVFEKNFEFNANESPSPYIVGAIYIKHKQKVVNFYVESNWTNESAPNYQGKGYGTSILNYIEKSLLPSFNEKEQWEITIASCRDTYERFKAHITEKEAEEELDR